MTLRQHKPPVAEVVSIGTELLLGNTVDTNAAYLSGELARLGFAVRGSRQIPDDQAIIAAALRRARQRSTLVVVTGGLGPTHDDVTREGLAEALGETLADDAMLVQRLRERFNRMPAENLKQARVVPSAEPVNNPIGSAPGWWVDRDDRVVILMPGVPSEMRLMWQEQFVPMLEKRFALRPLQVRTVKVFGPGESKVAALLSDLFESVGDDIQAGLYSRNDGVHVRFWTRGDGSLLAFPVRVALETLKGDAFGIDSDSLAEIALRLLGSFGISTLGSRESGTDGALLAILAAAPIIGESARYVGGVLEVEHPQQPPDADATLSIRLDRVNDIGASQALVSLTGKRPFETSIRIFGSGAQRQRRAGFGALDQVRRALA